MNLYHASYETLSSIHDSGVFGGIFASNDINACLSHHDNLHQVEVGSLLTQSELNYDLDYSIVRNALKSTVKTRKTATIDRLYEIVIEEDSNLSDDDIVLLNSDDLSEALCEQQRLRGQVAKKLGFDAVEMNDEHGTSYLVVNCKSIKKIQH